MRRMYDENQIKEIAGAASGGNKIYEHTVQISIDAYSSVYFKLYNTKADAFTKTTLEAYLAIGYYNTVIQATTISGDNLCLQYQGEYQFAMNNTMPQGWTFKSDYVRDISLLS